MGLHDRKTLHLTGCSVQRTAIFTPAQNAAFGPHSAHVFRSWPLNNGMPLTLLATERHQSVIFVTALAALGVWPLHPTKTAWMQKAPETRVSGASVFDGSRYLAVAPTAPVTRWPNYFSWALSSLPSSEGLRVMTKPDSSMMASLASAVSAPPEISAPAWPMRLPGGAVTPAM